MPGTCQSRPACEAGLPEEFRSACRDTPLLASVTVFLGTAKAACKIRRPCFFAQTCPARIDPGPFCRPATAKSVVTGARAGEFLSNLLRVLYAAARWVRSRSAAHLGKMSQVKFVPP